MNPTALYHLFATHPNGMWTLDPYFADRLYGLVKEYKPKRILDLGTGIGASAALAALALKDAGVEGFEIHTIENTEWLIDLAKEITPEELKENVTYHASPAVAWQDPNTPYQYFSTYQELPEGDWDLLIHDGPGPFLEGEHFIDLPNGTINKMLQENTLKAGTKIIWDKRLKALKILERYYGDNFYVVENMPQRGFYVLEKKDLPLRVDDTDKKTHEMAGYFNRQTPNRSELIQKQYDVGRNTGDGGDWDSSEGAVSGETPESGNSN